MSLRNGKITLDDLQAIVAWGSISYALGFVTVMLHTARLGFPVLELLQSVYIWIGAPLTFIAFFSLRIFRFFKKRAKKLSDEIRGSWQQLRADVAPDDIDVVSSFIGTVVVWVPILNLMPQTSIKILRIPFDRLLSRAKETTPADKQSEILWINRLASCMRGIRAFFEFIRLFNFIFLIIVAIYLYVWHVYPIIPQSYGGGASSKVKLLVNIEMISKNFPGITLPSCSSEERKKQKAFLTDELDLLYKSKDAYYLKGKKGIQMSLAKNVVEGIIWLKDK